MKLFHDKKKNTVQCTVTTKYQLYLCSLEMPDIIEFGLRIAFVYLQLKFSMSKESTCFLGFRKFICKYILFSN